MVKEELTKYNSKFKCTLFVRSYQFSNENPILRMSLIFVKVSFESQTLETKTWFNI